MGEVNGYYTAGGEEEEERVHEWEAGLPDSDDVTPLTQGLIPPGLLSAFNIAPEPCRTSGEVTKASEDTVSSLRGQSFGGEEIEEEEQEDEDENEERSESKKPRRNEWPEDEDSEAAAAEEKSLKRPRLVWTPQLHKRFVDVVAHLGIKNAVPKTIMQLMNVEGLTRENVASHLQKYRLYVKRMQGIPFEGPSNSSAASSEHHLPGNSPENGNGQSSMPLQMPYGAPMMPVPMPMMGMGMGMGMGNYNGFESHHHHHHHNHNNNNNSNNNNNQYNNGMMMQSGNNKYGSVNTSFVSYHHNHPHVAPGDK